MNEFFKMRDSEQVGLTYVNDFKKGVTAYSFLEIKYTATEIKQDI